MDSHQVADRWTDNRTGLSVHGSPLSDTEGSEPYLYDFGRLDVMVVAVVPNLVGLGLNRSQGWSHLG